ncbi:MAG: hypothetical protein ACI3XA_02130 [Clostridia bacterium]
MYYMAKLEKKTKLFQKAYRTKDNYIYITDTKRCKKKFLKSPLKNVLFTEVFLEDELFAGKIREVKDYDRNFILNYLENEILETVKLLKLNLPLEEIVIFSPSGRDISDKCVKYARLVTIVGETGEDYFKDGVPVRFLSKMKKVPDLFILEDEKKHISPLMKRAVIDIRENPFSGSYSLAWDKMCFKTDLFDFQISASVLIYFLKKGEISHYEVTNYRKKSPRIFTFG